MSDPVTNIEIEDVLSSIRKLVADGDKARTRDPAPYERSESEGESPAARPAPAPRPDKLVLTPAFLVSDGSENVSRDHPSEDTTAQVEDLPDMVWESVDDDTAEPADPEKPDADQGGEAEHETAADAGEDHAGENAPEAENTAVDAQDRPSDRTRLEASIAELEAAVSNDGHDFEPDGSEAEAETFYWPGSMVRPLHEIEDAQTDDDDAHTAETDEGDVSDDQQHGRTDEEATDEDDAEDADDWSEEDWGESRADEAQTANGEQQDADQPDTSHPEIDEADVYADDDLDDLLAAETESMDEEALRKLISEIVREELMGTLGERITRNVRKLVRREIYRILSSQEFD